MPKKFGMMTAINCNILCLLFLLFGYIVCQEERLILPIEVLVVITTKHSFWKNLFLYHSQLRDGDTLTLLVDEDIPNIKTDIGFVMGFITNSNKQVRIGLEKLVNSSLLGLQYCLRNRLASTFNELGFVWHVEESNFVNLTALDTIREICISPDIIYAFGHIGHTTESAMRFAMQDVIIPSKLLKSNKIAFGIQSNGDVLFDHLLKTSAMVHMSGNIVLWKSSSNETVASAAKLAHIIKYALPIVVNDNRNVSVSVELELLGDLDDMHAWHVANNICMSHNNNNNNDNNSNNITEVVEFMSCKGYVYHSLVNFASQHGFYNNESISDDTSHLLLHLLDVTGRIPGLENALQVQSMQEYLSDYYLDILDLQDNSGNPNIDMSSIGDNVDNWSWQRQTKVYLLNQMNCPSYVYSFMKDWMQYFHFPPENLYFVDEMSISLPFQLIVDIQHASALYHCIHGYHKYCLIIEDGLTFSDMTTAAHSLHSIFQWPGDIFDLFFLVTTDPPSALQEMHSFEYEYDAIDNSQSCVVDGNDSCSSPSIDQHNQNTGPRNSLFRRFQIKQPSRNNPLFPPRVSTGGYIVTQTYAVHLLRLCIRSIVLQHMGWPDAFYSFGVLLMTHLKADTNTIALQYSTKIAYKNTTLSSKCYHEMTFSWQQAWNNSNIVNEGETAIKDTVFTYNNYNTTSTAQQRKLALVVSGNLGNQLWTVFYAKATAIALNISMVLVLNDTRSELYHERLFRIPSDDPHLTVITIEAYNAVNYTLLLASSRKKLCATNANKNLSYQFRIPHVRIVSSSSKKTGRLTGIMPQYLALKEIRPLIVKLLNSPVDEEESNYMQMIYWNIVDIAKGKPLVIVCLDDWEGTPITTINRTANDSHDRGNSISNYYEADVKLGNRAKGLGNILVSAVYIRMAMLIAIREYYPTAPFFVFFTKELSLARDTFGLLPNTCFLGLETMPDYFTLKLMGLFQGAILSTSKYSWWAGYVIESKYQIVHWNASSSKPRSPTIIAPRVSHHRCKSSSLYPPSWILI